MNKQRGRHDDENLTTEVVNFKEKRGKLSLQFRKRHLVRLKRIPIEKKSLAGLIVCDLIVDLKFKKRKTDCASNPSHKCR